MVRFAFSAPDAASDQPMPRLPAIFSNGDHAVSVEGLVDSGSTINLLPYDYGLALGMVWDEHLVELKLTGALAQFEARAASVWMSSASLTGPEPVHLAVAWTRSNDARVIFGQINFFMEFNVCIYRSQNYFEVWRRE